MFSEGKPTGFISIRNTKLNSPGCCNANIKLCILIRYAEPRVPLGSSPALFFQRFLSRHGAKFLPRGTCVEFQRNKVTLEVLFIFGLAAESGVAKVGRTATLVNVVLVSDFLISSTNKTATATRPPH